MSEKRERLEETRRLGERLIEAGYGERVYEHDNPNLAQSWRASGQQALAELMSLVARLQSKEN